MSFSETYTRDRRRTSGIGRRPVLCFFRAYPVRASLGQGCRHQTQHDGGGSEEAPVTGRGSGSEFSQAIPRACSQGPEPCIRRLLPCTSAQREGSLTVCSLSVPGAAVFLFEFKNHLQPLFLCFSIPMKEFCNHCFLQQMKEKLHPVVLLPS